MRENTPSQSIDNLLAHTGEWSREQLVAALRSDQSQRWQEGSRPLVESYLPHIATLGEDPETVLALIYGEVVLREERGQTPQFEEYVQRFPQFATQLREHFALPSSRAGALEQPSAAADPYCTGAFEAGATAEPQPSPTGDDPFRTSPPVPPTAEAHDPFSTGPDLGADSGVHEARTDAGKPARPSKSTIEVPGYEILGVLGRGGMGVVYKARHLQLKRVVALKMILGSEHAGPEQLGRFQSEAEAVARLQHPNIVQVYEIGAQEGRPYFSLEFVDGGSLDKMIAGTPQPPRQAAELVETLARAMHAAHERGIVHRDLKPANVLLQIADRRSQIEKKEPGSIPQSAICDLQFAIPKITDFGLAKQLDDDTGHTRDGAVMGTPSYMAPEQAAGQTKLLGPPSDVYALAAILYELFTGHPPFKGATVWETLEQVRHQEPVPPTRLQPRLPRDLETICLKGLQKELPRRYASARELADDLHRYLAGEPILARPSGPWERTVKWVKRRPALASAAFLLMVCLLGAAGWGAQTVRNRLLLSDLRIDVQNKILKGKKDLGEGKLDKAESHAKHAEGMIRTEPQLADLEPEVQELLQEIDKKKDHQAKLQAAQKQYAAFVKSRNSALFHETLFTGVNQREKVLETRAAARHALAQYGVTLDSEGPPKVDDTYLDDAQKKSIVPYSYLLLLAWAEATHSPVDKTKEEPVAQAKEALRILERTRSFGLESKAYHMRRARYLAQAGERDVAVKELELAQQLQPRMAVDFFLVGVEAYNLARNPKMLDQAKSYLQEALKLEPEHFWASYSLAMCNLKLGLWEAARGNLNTCIAQQKDFLWPFLLRGYAHAQLKDFAAAEGDFAAAENLRPDVTVQYGIHVNRGFMLFRQGEEKIREPSKLGIEQPEGAEAHRQGQAKFNEALLSFQKAAQLKPDQYQAYVNMAEVYQRQHKLDEARAQFDKAIELESSAALYRSRARLHLLRKDYAAALPDLEKAVQLEPPGRQSALIAEDHIERGRIHFRNRKFDQALKAFDEAQQAHPDEYPLAERLRAETLLELNRHKEALQAIERYLARGEPLGDVYRARGLARAKLGNYPGAIEDYTHALEIDKRQLKPRSALTLGYRGWAYLICKAPELALRDFDEAVKLQSDNADAYNGRGTARAQLGNTKAALTDAEAALRIGPDSSRLLYNAARIFAQAADKIDTSATKDRQLLDQRLRLEDRALKLLRQALEMVPPNERSAFWQDYIQFDPALKAVRRTAAFAQMTVEFARVGK